MLNEPLPTSVKDLYRLRSEMAVELLNASGTMLYVHAAMHIHITILCVLCIFILMV